MVTRTESTSTLSGPNNRAPEPIRSAESWDAADFDKVIENYKRRSGRPIPAWSDLRELLEDLEYARRLSNGPHSSPPRIWINAVNGKGEQIKSILVQHGGVPSRLGIVSLYEFASETDRNLALHAVRSRHGWTSVDPAS
jgi:hypothetical protein